ncbi:unnamed protein product [Schistosoma mattheei]|uniref:Uncharacterized protein n=1 Tax=Schistosoma mattheei TaxID=31246 RepID=A0A183PBL8_9TREM|nr:unnamed protein product [Schistosoma mattheei]
MVVAGSQQKTLNLGFVLLGTHQYGVHVMVRELILPEGFDPMLPSITVRDVTTKLSHDLIPRDSNLRPIDLSREILTFTPLCQLASSPRN